KGDRAAADAELRKALEAEPPAELRQQIEQVVQHVERADKRVAVALRPSIGPEFDDNINVTPTDSTINLGDGAVISSRRASFNDLPFIRRSGSLTIPWVTA
ncbi:MAG: hypothetical protein ACREVK_08550, partial [Gammaproteobacteria bacterium]